MCSLLPYENQIFLDLFHNDGLLVMAEGLGVERIFLNFIKLYCDPTHLIMIINTNESEEKYFNLKLKQANVDYLPTRITTETHSIQERSQAYLKGGCFFITSRILVVDLLTDRIPVDLINGILVYKAHRIIDSCQESFILRLFRQKNKKGFIKAFSDDPIFFAKSFCKVERVMRNLFVKKLFIYPRFHVDITSTLENHKPEVIEIHVLLSKFSRDIQMSLLDIINVLLQELKGCCSYIDHDFLTMENVISKPFDRVIKVQLEPVWNQVGSKPKQLLNDMKTLRLLLHYLIQYDCVTFYKMLTCLKSHEKEIGRSSGWIFLDSANQLFLNARLRVFGSEKNAKNFKLEKHRSIFSKDNKELNERIIEENPKLNALKQVLQEISEDKDETLPEINVLIAANNDRTCLMIKQFLNNSEMLLSGLASKNVDLNEAITSSNVAGAKSARNNDFLSNLDGDDDDDDAAIEEFIEKLSLKNNLETVTNELDYLRAEKSDKNNKKKIKRKIKEKNVTTLTQMIKKKNTKNRVIYDDNDENDDDDTKNSNNDVNNESSSDTDVQEVDTDSNDGTNKKIDKKINLALSALEGSKKQKMALLQLLYEFKPKYVILYDSELRFVRQLEIYKINNTLLDLRIYFLMYTNSCEEQRYLTSIRSEKEAFELLIKEKAAMIVLEEQDGKQEFSLEELNDEKTTIEARISSRQGGNAVANKSKEEQKSLVIVDMREFRSELPSLLHKRGIHIEPITLEVGDYILTPDICVERKSLNDLIESLSNGRLYNQANSMCRYYKVPILLIEFDQNKPFLLNSNVSLSNEINGQHVSSKLVLLTMHFPKLRILWCSSPHETAELFEELKANYPQPNVEAAIAIKTDQIGENNESKYNPILQDLLLKIPGINLKNYKNVMNKVNNLHELCQMSEEKLSEILENSKNAKACYEFLNKTLNDNLNIDEEFLVEENSGTKLQKKNSSSSSVFKRKK